MVRKNFFGTKFKTSLYLFLLLVLLLLSELVYYSINVESVIK